jgi:molybdopterin-biosynthesis enzyme MoeA-like protein
MKRLSKPHKSQPNFDWDTPSAALTAKKRMAELPLDDSRPYGEQAIFVDDNLWVPVSVVNGNIHILPGVPRLFEAMLEGLKPHILPRLVDPEGKGAHRILISTPMAESAVAEYLTKLSAKAEPKGVKVGSYPRWGKSRNTVTLVGKDVEYMESLVSEVEAAVQGRRVQVEGEDDSETEPDEQTGTLKSG